MCAHWIDVSFYRVYCFLLLPVNPGIPGYAKLDKRMFLTFGSKKKADGSEAADQEWRAPPPNICALCGDELRPLLATAEQKAAQRPLHTLNCGHVFHEDCIRGWSILGKKDTCPYCHEKVEVARLYEATPWAKQAKAWAHVLDAVRYLVAWNPVILLAVHFFLAHTGLLPHLTPPGAAGAAALAHNATAAHAAAAAALPAPAAL